MQEKIGRWVRRERDEGRNVKARYTRVMIEGRWVRWDDIEQGMVQENVEDNGEGEAQGYGGSRGREKGKEKSDFRNQAKK